MSDTGTDLPIEAVGGLPLGGELALESGGFTASELTGTLGPAFADLDAAVGVDDLLKQIDKVEATFATRLGGTQAAQMKALMGGLTDAVETGTVLPGQTNAAIGFVLATGGVEVLANASVEKRALEALFTHFGIDFGNKPHAKIVPPAKAPAPAPTSAGIPAASADVPKPATVPAKITVGVAVPEPSSPGGKLVAQAEKAIKRTTVTVPGLSKTAAHGVSLAISRSYQNMLAVLVTTLNDVENQIGQLGAEVSTLTGYSSETAKAIGSVQTFMQDRLDLAEKRIANLVSGLDTLQGYETGLQNQITRLATSPPPAVTGTAPGGLQGITPAEAALIATIPTLATSSQLSAVADAEAADAQAITGLELETQAANLPNLPTTITDLEDCCEANEAVTKPIADGGATPGLLSKLGPLLGLFAITSWVAGIASGILAALDLDDSIIGTVRAAEIVAPIAVRAAAVALADTEWASTVRGAAS